MEHYPILHTKGVSMNERPRARACAAGNRDSLSAINAKGMTGRIQSGVECFRRFAGPIFGRLPPVPIDLPEGWVIRALVKEVDHEIRPLPIAEYRTRVRADVDKYLPISLPFR